MPSNIPRAKFTLPPEQIACANAIGGLCDGFINTWLALLGDVIAGGEGVKDEYRAGWDKLLQCQRDRQQGLVDPPEWQPSTPPSHYLSKE